MRASMPATLLIAISVGLLPAIGSAACSGSVLQLGDASGSLKDRYCLRGQVHIREVDSSNSTVDWGTTCDVELSGLNVATTDHDCPYQNPLHDGDTLQVIPMGPGTYGLYLKRGGSSLTATKWIPLQAKSVLGSTNVLWLASQSPLSLNGKSYDVRVYFLDDSGVISTPTIEKHYLIELFDTSSSSSCIKYEPEYMPPTKVLSTGKCPISGGVKKQETQVGDGKEHHSN